jgi:hypothetical protein
MVQGRALPLKLRAISGVRTAIRSLLLLRMSKLCLPLWSAGMGDGYILLDDTLSESLFSLE